MTRAALAAVLAPLLVAAGLIGAALVLTPPPPTTVGCSPGGPAVTVAVSGVPAGPIAGYSGVQLVNAALVIEAGRALGIDARGQVIGVMTAMGESSLMVIDYGDAAGPDSRGLFQQRANGAWGSYADRMDPTTSATSFFRALLAVEGWQTLPPTIAAHRTQRNADPFHYTRWWDDALQVVGGLAGAAVTGLASGTGHLACTAAAPLIRLVDGWTFPAAGPLTSTFGVRNGPTGGGLRLHAGVDLAPGCDAPIIAAAAGVVVRSGPAGGYGNLIVVDHGSGVVTRYGHMEDDDLLVVVGQQVSAGQQVARVGTKGDSTGCHLHFEVLLDGTATDPLAFLAVQGVDLR